MNISSNTNSNHNTNLNPSNPAPVTSPSRLSITEHKFQRSLHSCEKRELTAEEVNASVRKTENWYVMLMAILLFLLHVSQSEKKISCDW